MTGTETLRRQGKLKKVAAGLSPSLWTSLLPSMCVLGPGFSIFWLVFVWMLPGAENSEYLWLDSPWLSVHWAWSGLLSLPFFWLRVPDLESDRATLAVALLRKLQVRFADRSTEVTLVLGKTARRETWLNEEEFREEWLKLSVAIEPEAWLEIRLWRKGKGWHYKSTVWADKAEVIFPDSPTLRLESDAKPYQSVSELRERLCQLLEAKMASLPEAYPTG